MYSFSKSKFKGANPTVVYLEDAIVMYSGNTSQLLNVTICFITTTFGKLGQCITPNHQVNVQNILQLPNNPSLFLFSLPSAASFYIYSVSANTW
jgi:hypothetical protein